MHSNCPGQSYTAARPYNQSKEYLTTRKMDVSVDEGRSIINVLDLATPPSGQTVGQPSSPPPPVDSRAWTTRRPYKSMTLEEADAITAQKRFADITANSRRYWSDDDSNGTGEGGRRRGWSAAEYGPYHWSDDFNLTVADTGPATVDLDTGSTASTAAHLAPSSSTSVYFTNGHTEGVPPAARLVGASAMLAAASAFTFAPAEMHGARINENDFGDPTSARDNNDDPSLWTRSKEYVADCFVNAIRRMCFCNR